MQFFFEQAATVEPDHQHAKKDETDGSVQADAAGDPEQPEGQARNGPRGARAGHWRDTRITRADASRSPIATTAEREGREHKQDNHGGVLPATEGLTASDT